MITIDKKMLSAFDSLRSGISLLRNWKPTEEQAEIIRKYWLVKRHSDFIKAFRAKYPDAPKADKTYQKIYASIKRS